MGAWSTSINGNDTAEDLKQEYTVAFWKFEVPEALQLLDEYVRQDFDESDRFGKNEFAGILMCTFLYTAASLLFDWFDGSEVVTALFALYIIFTYICVILCYIVKRRLDTRQLNKLLTNYKQHETKNEGSASHEC